ncbi:MAG: Deoxyguanosinetriphosphate triphosphohydrolase [Lentisphaerae bacterium ADurb.BinA184]|nr:MAG: Deoxyguanosinetriphosphate triphosphohydrolase [Lentisphaerae bacterium ADurb.BinA184]
MSHDPASASQSDPRGEERLAAWAVRNSQSRGRRVPEPAHGFRQDFQRDRDRVIHSRAFRRLDGKTQVFLSGAGDHFRTRLTHTIEVATLARTLARRLRANEDLAEAIALAHDLGHTPFGHMGENALNDLLAAEGGGFDHNEQSLRVVDVLEKKYPWVDGLNLTWEVRSGLVKNRAGRTCRLDGEALPPQPSVEAQIADLADDLAYYTHDLDDALEGRLIGEADLAPVRLWQLADEMARRAGSQPPAESHRAFVVRCLIDTLVADVIESSQARLAAAAPANSDGAQHLAAPVIAYTPEFRPLCQELHDFLCDRVYRHPDLNQVRTRVTRVMNDLFAFFRAHPEHLGLGARRRVGSQGITRAAADYLAGMTDAFALAAHARLIH